MADSKNRGVKRKRAPRGSLTEAAKKHNKRISNWKYNRRRSDLLRTGVNIYGQFTRWSDFKTTNGVVDDEQAAQMLLDHYESWKLQSERLAAPDNAEIGIPDSPTVRGLLKPLKHRTNISTASTCTPVDQDPIVQYLSQVSSVYGSDSNKVSSYDTEVAPSSIQVKKEFGSDSNKVSSYDTEVAPSSIQVKKEFGSDSNKVSSYDTEVAPSSSQVKKELDEP